MTHPKGRERSASEQSNSTIPVDALVLRNCPHWVGDIYRNVGLECPLCKKQREREIELDY